MLSPSYLRLLEKYRPHLFKVALNMTKNKADASDLLQDTLAHLLKKETRFEADTDFKAWSSTVMKNIFLQGHRLKTRRMELLKTNPIPTRLLWEKNEAERHLIIECVVGVINELEEKLRQPFQMHVKGFKYEEIAEECQLPLGTVKNRIFWARKKLKNKEKEIMACF